MEIKTMDNLNSERGLAGEKPTSSANTDDTPTASKEIIVHGK
jgi:hypothetical protein